jgi:hypothetical protein
MRHPKDPLRVSSGAPDAGMTRVPTLQHFYGIIPIILSILFIPDLLKNPRHHSLHQAREQLIPVHRLEQPRLDRPFDAAAGEVVEFDVGAVDALQVDRFRVCPGEAPHHPGEGHVPVLQGDVRVGGAAVVDVHVYAEVALVGVRGLQRPQVGGDPAEAPGVLAGPGLHVLPHDQAPHPGIVIVDQPVAGAAVGL